MDGKGAIDETLYQKAPWESYIAIAGVCCVRLVVMEAQSTFCSKHRDSFYCISLGRLLPNFHKTHTHSPFQHLHECQFSDYRNVQQQEAFQAYVSSDGDQVQVSKEAIAWLSPAYAVIHVSR
ncbi:hypothetical protein BDZ45DRAFT_741878 [Acephala macrosclerotiorum]|nr:hypothetical protein BDZ45DRAFT_741878 [Acephala macrosclerotiorum]